MNRYFDLFRYKIATSAIIRKQTVFQASAHIDKPQILWQNVGALIHARLAPIIHARLALNF